MHSARYSACVVPKSLLNRYDFAHTLVSQLRGFGTNLGFYLLVYRSVTCQPRSCEPHHIMTHSALLIYSASSILVIGLPGKRQYPAEISFTVRVFPATGSQYRMGGQGYGSFRPTLNRKPVEMTPAPPVARPGTFTARPGTFAPGRQQQGSGQTLRTRKMPGGKRGTLRSSQLSTSRVPARMPRHHTASRRRS
jgi:hypothetical protein